MKNIKLFLDEKPLFYDEIDYERMPKAYNIIKSQLPKPNIIHIIGTNGKGTTGRFLATALYNLGFSVGHYTSPHIVEFNERIWIDGKNVDNDSLEIVHKKLYKMLGAELSERLSYFEYTTFLAMLLFENCKYVVMEAGLGGEHDATAVFDKVLTLVTPVDIDHESFLGNSIDDIATTKLNAMQKHLIIGKQKFAKVYDIAQNIAYTKGAVVYKYEDLLDENDIVKIMSVSKELNLTHYLQDNLKLAISALKFLKLEYKTDSFKNSKLFGRLTPLDENILIDVGHNPLAATSILKELNTKKYVLIYNSYKDKDYKKILEILKPIILHVEIIDIDDERAESMSKLQSTLNILEIQYSPFVKINKDLSYLVFGSFSVVEKFLKVYGG